MPQQVGSGAAFLDFNNDGRLDIYLLQNGGPDSSSRNRLFMQTPDGHFQDVSRGSGLDIAGYNMGVAVGDINNDGWPDILVTQYGGVRLFLNRGDGTFADITAEAGLTNPGWGASAAFFDFDRDGLLDLVVVNYVDYDPTWPCTGPYGKPDYCAPKTFKGRVSRLFRNVSEKGGKTVRFEDVTVASGLGSVLGPGLGVICADFDGDGWPDIFIANDGAPNRLWINQHDVTFKEEAVRRGGAYNAMAQAGWRWAWPRRRGRRRPPRPVRHPPHRRNEYAVETGPAPDCIRIKPHRSPSQRSLARHRLRHCAGRFDHDGALDLALVNRTSLSTGST